MLSVHRLALVHPETACTFVIGEGGFAGKCLTSEKRTCECRPRPGTSPLLARTVDAGDKLLPLLLSFVLPLKKFVTFCFRPPASQLVRSA